MLIIKIKTDLIINKNINKYKKQQMRNNKLNVYVILTNCYLGKYYYLSMVMEV